MPIRLNADQLSRIQGAVNRVDQRCDGLVVGRHKVMLEEMVESILKIVLPEATISTMTDAPPVRVAASSIPCDVCKVPASFIQHGIALCFEHRQ